MGNNGKNNLTMIIDQVEMKSTSFTRKVLVYEYTNRLANIAAVMEAAREEVRLR